MSYDSEPRDFRRILGEMTTLGHPEREEELAELHQLIHRYPDVAGQLIAELADPSHGGAPA